MADPIADLLVKVSADISGMQTSFTEAENKLATFGQNATAAGAELIKLGAPLTGLGIAAAKVAGDFEASMNILGVAAGGAGVSMEDLRSVALKAGSDVTLVGVGAADVAVAMTNFTKAGVSASDMLGNMEGYLAGTAEMGGQLRAAIDLAAASELDLDQASRLVITTMATFGLSAEDASAAMDTYVRAADASVMSVQDIAMAMENVGPTMAQFGFSVEDVSIALALLSTRGIAGAEAGTALKSMMVNLMRPTADVTETLKAMNVSLYDQAGNMKPLPEIMAQLERGMAGMTEEQRNNTIETLAGSYGMKAMSTLLAEGTVGWNSMAGSIDNASTMQETASARTKGFNASMEQLKSTIEGFLINVGTPLIENVLTPMVQKLSDIGGKLSEMDPKWVEFAIVAGGLVTGLGALLLVVGQIATAFSALAPIAGAIVGALSPIAVPIVAIGAALAALYLAWDNNWFGIRDTLTKVWEETLKPILDKLMQLWSDLVSFFKSGDISDVFTDLSDLFGDNFANAAADVLEQMRDFVGDVKGLWNNLVSALKSGDFSSVGSSLRDIFGSGLINGIESAINAIREFNTTLGNAMGPAITTAKNVLAGLATFFTASLLPALVSVNNFIGTYLAPIFRGLADVASGVLGVALTALHGLWDKVLYPTLQTVWNFIKTNLVPVFVLLADKLSTALEPPLKVVQDLFAKLGPALQPIGGFLSNIATWLQSVADKLKILKLPDWLTPGSPTPFETALRGILDALKAVAGGPWDWFTKFTNWLGGSGGGGGGVTINVTVSDGAVVVYGADPYSMGRAVAEAIARALQALIASETKYGPGAGWALP